MFSFKIPKMTLKKVNDLKPAKGLLIVAPIDFSPVQTTDSGLFVVTGDNEEQAKTFPVQFGRVLAVGDDLEDTYKAGDTVFYHKYSGQDGDLLTDSFRIIRAEEVWGFASIELEE